MMIRLRLALLSLVVGVAIGSLAASSASGAEVGECLKLPKLEGKFHGKYTDKNCQAPATPTEEAEGRRDKWEWSPGVTSAHAAFTAKSKTVGLVGAAGFIECKKSSTVGEWTGPKTATEQTTFVGCAIKGPEGYGACQSAGHPEETIVTNTLDVALLGEGEESFNVRQEPYGGPEPEPVTVGPGEVWEQLRGPGGELGAVQMEYECDKVVVIQTAGSIAGVLAPGSVNMSSKKAEVAFGEGKGAQGWTSEANILGKGFVPIGKGVLQLTNQAKYAAKIELRS
jgi:hypothetical protein